MKYSECHVGDQVMTPLGLIGEVVSKLSDGGVVIWINSAIFDPKDLRPVKENDNER
jgi:preprotein translocase subunit YajC